MRSVLTGRDTHWFNTVKIPRTTTEAHLGPKALESRARNFFILGISLGLVFDIANGSDFLKAVNRVLDEWETMGEGGSKVVSICLDGRYRADVAERPV